MSKYPLCEKAWLSVKTWGVHFKMPQGHSKYPEKTDFICAEDVERYLKTILPNSTHVAESEMSVKPKSEQSEPKLGEWKFTAADFFMPDAIKNVVSAANDFDRKCMASIANARLAEMIQAAPVVYGVPNAFFSHVQGELPQNGGPDTHSARLICIEPLVRESRLEQLERFVEVTSGWTMQAVDEKNITVEQIIMDAKALLEGR